MDKDEDFVARIARAREDGHDVIADQCVTLADTQPLDQVEVAWRRLQVETRLKLLAKWNPKKYGTKVALGGDPGNPIQVEAQVEADGFLAAIMKNAELKRQVSANE